MQPHAWEGRAASKPLVSSRSLESNQCASAQRYRAQPPYSMSAPRTGLPTQHMSKLGTKGSKTAAYPYHTPYGVSMVTSQYHVHLTRYSARRLPAADSLLPAHIPKSRPARSTPDCALLHGLSSHERIAMDNADGVCSMVWACRACAPTSPKNPGPQDQAGELCGYSNERVNCTTLCTVKQGLRGRKRATTS